MVVHKPSGLEDKLKLAIEQAKKATLNVGWNENAAYPDGTKVAYVAGIQEFGAPAASIPPRPFMRPTIEKKSEEWKTTMAKFTKQVIIGKNSMNASLESMGLIIAGDIRNSISEGSFAPLSPKTIQARKNRLANKGQGAKSSIEKPLVDTGIMLGSLTSEVIE